MTEYVAAEDGVGLAYESLGEGPAVMLVHGFASSRVQNWRAPGWYTALTGAGYRVVATDLRGHGDSGKPHDPSAYAHDLMARDVIAVMDAAGADEALLMGYSMGAMIGMHILLRHAARVRKFVIGGVGETYLDGSGTRDRMADPLFRNEVADALLAPDRDSIVNPTARMFRDFAEQSGKDRAALAACMRADRKTFRAADLAHAAQPVLVVCGSSDNLTGAPKPLADAFPNNQSFTVLNRDHMTTVGDKLYKQAVLEFFAA
jgi:pimeloyl-ACP methyl ester carboxylesterase